MQDFLFYTGIIIVGVASLGLMVSAIRQNGIRNQVKDIPRRYEEWVAQYRVRRGYFYIAQAIGVVLAIIGLMI